MTAGPRDLSLVADERDAGRRLDQFLAVRVPDLSRAQAQRLIRDGHVTLSAGSAKAALLVSTGLTVDVRMPAPVAATQRRRRVLSVK